MSGLELTRILDAQAAPDSDVLTSEIQQLKRENSLVKLALEKQSMAMENIVSQLNEMKSMLVAQQLSTGALELTMRPIVAARKNEDHYQTLLQNEFGLGHKSLKGVGITDVTTGDAHIEIKRWSRSDEAMGQLAKYQQACPRARSCVYFFGVKPANKKLHDTVALFLDKGVEVYSFCDDDSIEKHERVNAVPKCDIFAEFKRDTLVFVPDSRGLPSKDVCICHKKTVEMFNDWYFTRTKTHPNENEIVVRLDMEIHEQSWCRQWH